MSSTVPGNQFRSFSTSGGLDNLDSRLWIVEVVQVHPDCAVVVTRRLIGCHSFLVSMVGLFGFSVGQLLLKITYSWKF